MIVNIIVDGNNGNPTESREVKTTNHWDQRAVKPSFHNDFRRNINRISKELIHKYKKKISYVL